MECTCVACSVIDAIARYDLLVNLLRTRSLYVARSSSLRSRERCRSRWDSVRLGGLGCLSSHYVSTGVPDGSGSVLAPPALFLRVPLASFPFHFFPKQPRISQEERQARDAQRKRTRRRNVPVSTDPEVFAHRERTRQRLADQRRLRHIADLDTTEDDWNWLQTRRACNGVLPQ
jgi:hypothetical protein